MNDPSYGERLVEKYNGIIGKPIPAIELVAFATKATRHTAETILKALNLLSETPGAVPENVYVAMALVELRTWKLDRLLTEAIVNLSDRPGVDWRKEARELCERVLASTPDA